MLDFLALNWDSILVILVFIGLIIFFAVKGKKKIVCQMLYALVTEAEKIYGSGTGSVKFAYVVEKVYSYMPAILKIFITYDALRDMIERALEEAKIAWGKEAGIEMYLAEEKSEETEVFADEGSEDEEAE